MKFKNLHVKPLRPKIFKIHYPYYQSQLRSLTFTSPNCNTHLVTKPQIQTSIKIRTSLNCKILLLLRTRLFRHWSLKSIASKSKKKLLLITKRNSLTNMKNNSSLLRKTRLKVCSGMLHSYLRSKSLRVGWFRWSKRSKRRL